MTIFEYHDDMVESTDVTPSRASAQPKSAERPRRRHRPRDETRALLLQAAARVAIERVSEDAPQAHNALADIRIKDVLDEVNRAEASAGGGPLTTGAFYQIWADQAEFQRELLAHLMDQIANPGASEIEALAFQMVSDGEPADEILRRVGDLDFTLSRKSPEMFLALGLGAMVPAELVRGAQREANSRYIAALSDLLGNVLRYGGRRLRDGHTMEDLIWATEALEVGYLLRSRTDPDIPAKTDARGWSSHAIAFVGIVHAFTETGDANG
ncbi:hypothetical protein [Microbacterium sp. EST19A]|uniref:hypothetical protein n=1 Tax=Microbacterium sp. EST19A TaxID=2862681 RepID=UPI001CBC0932|nr:hypothetical protein [Microbacterium sp. EST19A]